MGKGVFDGEEGILTGGGPVLVSVLLCEVMEGAGDIRKVGDESSIEIAETNK
jgi:hypothetical protein